MKTLGSFWGRLVALLLLAAAPLAGAAENGALITSLEGKVGRIAIGSPEALQAFEKLKPGDVLTLEGNARIRLVFFASQRQESWQGSGRIEIGSDRATATGLAEPVVRILPEIMVRQIAKTPTADSQGRAGAVRLRSIPTPDAIAKLDINYKQLRADTAADDINPEIFLLSGLLELRQLDRIEEVLSSLKTSHPGNMEASVLTSLYRKTLKNLRDTGK